MYLIENPLIIFLVFLLILLKCIISENIEVPLKYEREELVLSFPATSSDAVQMASKFCNERIMKSNENKVIEIAEEKETIKECIKTIGKYLIDQVQSHNTKKKFNKLNQRVPKEDTKRGQDPVNIVLEIMNEKHSITVDPLKDDILSVSKEFCIENMLKFGLVRDTINSCVDPVKLKIESVMKKLTENVPTLTERGHKASDIARPNPAFKTAFTNMDGSSSIQQKATDKTLSVALQIAGQTFDLHINPSIETSNFVATAFCRSNMKKFNLIEPSLVNCISPVQTRLEEVLLLEKSKQSLSQSHTSKIVQKPRQTNIENNGPTNRGFGNGAGAKDNSFKSQSYKERMKQQRQQLNSPSTKVIHSCLQ
jgi:hypothetical protein